MVGRIEGMRSNQILFKFYTRKIFSLVEEEDLLPVTQEDQLPVQEEYLLLVDGEDPPLAQEGDLALCEKKIFVDLAPAARGRSSSYAQNGISCCARRGASPWTRRRSSTCART